MNVRPFELATCPRVGAREARATRAALPACARLPERWRVELPPLGAATMSFVGLEADADRVDGVELPVSFGVGRGCLSIDDAFATRLVDAVLGGSGVFSVGRAAGPAERGVLAGVLATVFNRIGGSIQLGPVPSREARPRESASLSFRLETAIAAGWLRLAPPPGQPAARADDVALWRARAGRIPITALVDIAATGLAVGAIAALSVGDAVVFDGQRSSAFAAGGAWNARLVVGNHAADAIVDADGKLSIAGGFAPLQHEERHMSATGSSNDATTVLAGASIEVVAELGRISMRGDEVLGLAPGAVLALGARPTAVVLRVGGEPWADGEIVDIDGELGVRVTRLAHR